MRRNLRPAMAAVALLAALAACGESEGEVAAGEPDPERGQELFDANCAVCHGAEAQGGVTGPPLVHRIYEPSHHPDQSFHQAVTEGVPAHHWEFGDMPQVGGLDRDDVDDIIAYVRGLQRDAGIE